jgi:signal transduction histidine kinase
MQLGNLTPIEGRREQLHQLIVNLLENATQAVPPNGHITLRSGGDTEWPCNVKEVAKNLPAERCH